MPPKSAPAPVVYPRVSFAVCADPAKTGVTPELAVLIRSKLAEIGCEGLLSYNPPMTWLDAVTVLGAEWDTGDTFGDDYLFVDREGRKVRCTHNVRNRPITMSAVETRVGDILNHRWELNGETGVVGRDAVVLDFQHTCVALILAYQDWLLQTDPATGGRRWLTAWPVEKYPDGPTIDKCVVYGIENSDRVVNTINTGRPRSLADVFYRCPYFSSLPQKAADHCDRATAAKVAADAIKVVWHRTGMYMANFGSTMTHSEACAWVENHGGVRSRLLEAVRHVLECNRDGRITAHVRLGYAAAMCFLMGQWDTDDAKVGKYYADDVRNGNRLSFAGWDRAKEFWTHFGTTKTVQEQVEPTGPLRHLTEVLTAESVIEAKPDYDGGPRSRQRDYAIVSAWRAYRKAGATVKAAQCEVKYTRADRYGVKSLDWSGDEKAVGGIDLGNDRIAPDPDDVATPTVATVVKAAEAPVAVVKPDVSSGASPRKDKIGVRDEVEGEPATILTAAADSTTDLLALIHVEHPDFDCVLLRTPTGGYAAWGDDEIEKVAPYLSASKHPKLHPKGLRFVSFRPDEVEVLSDHLTGAGMCMALCVEVVTADRTAARYAVEVVHRGAKPS